MPCAPRSSGGRGGIAESLRDTDPTEGRLARLVRAGELAIEGRRKRLAEPRSVFSVIVSASAIQGGRNGIAEPLRDADPTEGGLAGLVRAGELANQRWRNRLTEAPSRLNT
jgi:hypothetical protein